MPFRVGPNWILPMDILRIQSGDVIGIYYESDPTIPFHDVQPCTTEQQAMSATPSKSPNKELYVNEGNPSE